MESEKARRRAASYSGPVESEHPEVLGPETSKKRKESPQFVSPVDEVVDLYINPQAGPRRG